MAPIARNPVIGHFALELDGKVAGFVRQVTGGGVHADVIETATARDKHLGQVRFEDLVLTVGTGLSRDFHDWVASTVSGAIRHKNGAVLACDFNYKVLSRLEWTRGLIRAVNFPALDAASKNQAALTVKITPEVTRSVAGDGSQVKLIDASKPWLASSFRLMIDGLESACPAVSRIETITIAQEIKSFAVGSERLPQNEPARRSLSDLVVRLPESRAKPFYDWAEDFIVKGNNSAAQEKNGYLDFLTAKQSATLFSLRFDHLGIYAITPSSRSPGAEIRTVEVKMYCEDIRLSARGA